MNFVTWNVQGVRQQIEIKSSEVKKINLDIVALTETKKKGSGMGIIGDYVHIYTGVSKEKSVARGVSLLKNKRLKHKITNWETVKKNILKLNIQSYEHNTKVIAL